MSAAAGHPLSDLVWALTPVDVAQKAQKAQNAIDKEARRKVFEVMNKQGERRLGAVRRGCGKRCTGQGRMARTAAQRDWWGNPGAEGAGFKQRTNSKLAHYLTNTSSMTHNSGKPVSCNSL